VVFPDPPFSAMTAMVRKVCGPFEAPFAALP